MVATPHPLPYWFASGLSFFPGLLLIAAAACIPLGRLPRRRLAARAATAGAGAALAILSAAPLPPWACGLGGAVVAAMAVGIAKAGADVAIWARNAERNAEVVEEIASRAALRSRRGAC